MGGFSELIKNFEKTRDYVRDFFVYGYKVRGDFGRKSSRTYDDEKRRAESWLGDCLRYDDSVRGRQISISVDSGRIPENPLYQAYYSKSFTDNDIRLHFFLLDILADSGSLSLKEIVERLDERFGFMFEEQTVRNKLKEYANEGILIAEKHGRASYFRLSEDTADSIFADIDGLSDAVKFFSEGGVLGIVGNSLLKAADMHNDLFFIKHNYIVHTLEDFLLPELIRAMDEKRFVSFRNSSAKQADDEGRDCVAVPLCILDSVQTGRRYLAVYITEFKRFTAYRLDRISKVKVGKICERYDELYERFTANSGRCFGVSFGSRDHRGENTPLKLTFYIDEADEGYVVNRLKREKRCGVLERTDDNLFSLTFDVFDPNEVMHWAKTFIGRIVSVEGGNSALRERFYSDMRRMKEMYGGEENDDIQ